MLTKVILHKTQLKVGQVTPGWVLFARAESKMEIIPKPAVVGFTLAYIK